MVEKKTYLVIYYVRFVWSFFWGAIYNFICLLKFCLFKDVRIAYKVRKSLWEKIKSFDDLLAFIKNYYQYNSEIVFDHDTTEFEFFIRWGDCDDVALMVLKKLKQLGYKASRIILKGNNLFDWHFDTLFYDEISGKYYLFNYGALISGDSIYSVLNKFCEVFFDLTGYYIVNKEVFE